MKQPFLSLVLLMIQLYDSNWDSSSHSYDLDYEHLNILVVFRRIKKLQYFLFPLMSLFDVSTHFVGSVCVHVCLKKAQCGVRPSLYCTSQAFPGQQEEGWYIEVIHRCMCWCVCAVFGREKHRKNCDHFLQRRLIHKNTRMLFFYMCLLMRVFMRVHRCRKILH